MPLPWKRDKLDVGLRMLGQDFRTFDSFSVAIEDDDENEIISADLTLTSPNNYRANPRHISKGRDLETGAL